MKNKLILNSILVLSLFLITSFGQAQGASNATTSVAIGDTANYKVTKNELYFPEYRLYFQYLFTFFNVSDIPFNSNFSLSTAYNTVNIFSNVVEGTVIGTTVSELPGNQLLGGSLLFTYNSTSWTEKTGFVLGTPVVSTNWTYWSEFLANLPSYQNANHTITAQASGDNSNVFSATFSLAFTYLPYNISSDGVEKLTFIDTAIYNKSTGVLESMQFTVESKTPIKSIYQNLIVNRTNDAPSTNVKVPSSRLPGFEYLTLLPAFAIFAVYYLRKRAK